MGNGSYYPPAFVLDGAHALIERYGVSCLVKTTYRDQREGHFGCVYGIFECCICFLRPVWQLQVHISHANGFDSSSISCRYVMIDWSVVGEPFTVWAVVSACSTINTGAKFRLGNFERFGNICIC